AGTGTDAGSRGARPQLPPARRPVRAGGRRPRHSAGERGTDGPARRGGARPESGLISPFARTDNTPEPITHSGARLSLHSRTSRRSVSPAPPAATPARTTTWFTPFFTGTQRSTRALPRGVVAEQPPGAANSTTRFSGASVRLPGTSSSRHAVPAQPLRMPS